MEANCVKGTCLEMCPLSEIAMREKEGLVHVLETTRAADGRVKPKPDRKRMVKSFSRSAAGKQMLNPRNLRPPHVLHKTIKYLMEDVLENDRVPWHVTYDFIMDRLRSVRQDMVIQNLTLEESIQILQPVIRFHAYASYRLCAESVHNFDPHINRIHLQECLKRLLCLYDEFDSGNNSETLVNKDRSEFEALYLIVNLGDTTALLRALNLTKNWRTDTVKLALLVSLSKFENNFVKVCRLIGRLPVLLQLVAATKLPEIRRQALKVMSVAYNSKNLTFPLERLQRILLYKNVTHAKNDCVYYGLSCIEDQVQFVKSDFAHDKVVVPPEHVDFIDEALKMVDLSDLILNGQF